mgnify:CR=1 FL=1
MLVNPARAFFKPLCHSVAIPLRIAASDAPRTFRFTMRADAPSDAVRVEVRGERGGARATVVYGALDQIKKKTTKDPLELLNPKAASAFQRMLEGSKPGAEPTGKAAVKPGNYVWKNGALVPE